ncbi:MAG: hypothetical protein JO061_03235 [Acidobacteriaceae bacterium]|nr:hypothetical protein [Acidobacteriaceae bacterium]
MAKQTRITMETLSLLSLQGRILRRAWCPQCGAESEVITLDDVGVISTLERPEVQEWFKSSGLHHSQTVDGAESICLNSLLARVRNTKSS